MWRAPSHSLVIYGVFSGDLPRSFYSQVALCLMDMASILVIDDDLAVRGLFEQVLQSDGHTVYLAATAAAAYDVLRCSPSK